MKRYPTFIIILLIFIVAVGVCQAFLQSSLHHSLCHARTLRKFPLSISPSIQLIEKQKAFDHDDKVNECADPIESHEDHLVEEFGPAFAKKLVELQKYKTQHGHCLVPKRYALNPSLGNWVNKQRQNYRKFLNGETTSMRQNRVDALKRIGFVFDTHSISNQSSYCDRAWQSMFDQLREYHQIHGHTLVPHSALSKWIVRQRFLYRTGDSKSSLTKNRIDLLNSLGFDWNTRSERLWQQRVSELKEFHRIHKHCLVPRRYPPNPQLGAWVATQRKSYNRKLSGNQSSLTAERQKELENLGFVWNYWDYTFKLTQFI